MAGLGKESLAPYWRHLARDYVESKRQEDRYRDYSEDDFFLLWPALEIAKRHQDPTEKHQALEKSQLEKYIAEAQASRQERSTLQAKCGVNADIYNPLVVGEIRVFELHPGRYEEPLRGRLHYIDVGFRLRSKRHTLYGVSLDDGKPVPFTALSYVWGSPVTEDAISIEDRALPITKTLGVCLRHLRSDSNAVVLWVDQICIDQRDTKEKEQQVLLMKTIYSRAFNTVIWLGPEPDHGAFGSLELVDGSASAYLDDLSHDERNAFAEQVFENTAMGTALCDLFCRPWFTRTWTIQEVVLSNNRYIMSGSSSIAWELFEMIMVLHDFGILEIFSEGCCDPELTGRGQAAARKLIELVHDQFSVDEPGKLYRVLTDTRHAAVTEPVDKIYGVLGLHVHQIVPDYSKSATDVFLECTIADMREMLEDDSWYEAVSLLCCVDHDPHDNTALPSWVPDWSRPRWTHSLGYTTHDASIYRAGGIPLRGQKSVQLSHDSVSLDVDASKFDSIHSISPTVIEADLSADDPAQRNSSLRWCIEFALSNKVPFETFCETIVAGKDGTGMQKCGNRYHEILSLLCDETCGSRPTFDDQAYTARQEKGHFTLENLKTRTPGRLFQGLRKAYKRAMLHRRLCWTQSGRLGLVPRFARQDDELVIIPGAAIPFVVRRRHGRSYTLIGECYIHGAMDGSVMEAAGTPLSVLSIV